MKKLKYQINGKLKESCPNCKETKEICACLRNKCIDCGRPVGNITFTARDECWVKENKND